MAYDMIQVIRQDGSEGNETPAEARREVERQRAVPIDESTIRRLRQGEDWRQAMRDAWGVMVVAAANRVVERRERGGRVVRLSLGDGREVEVPAGWAETLLRWGVAVWTGTAAMTVVDQDARHASAVAAGQRAEKREIRQVHGLSAEDPLGAITSMIRGARLAPKVGHGRGTATVGAASCGGFSSATQRLAGGADPATSPGPSHAGDRRREAQAQAALARQGGGR